MDLFDYIRAVRKRKTMIIGGVIAVVAAAVVVSLALPEKYEAESTLMIEQSLIPGETDAASLSPRVIESFGNTYQRVVNNNQTLKKAVEKFNLSEKPYEMTWEKLGSNCINVQPVRGSRLITVTVTLQDPELAQKLANYIADQAVERATQLGTTGAEKSQKILREKRDKARQEMETAASRLEKFRKTAKLPFLRKEIDILLNRKEDLERQIASVRVSIQQKRKTLARVEEALSDQKPILELRRSLARDDLYQQMLARLGEEKQKNLLDLSMLSEQQNPTFLHLQRRSIDLQSGLEGLEAKLKSLKGELSSNTAELEKLQEERVTKELQLQEKKREYNLRKGNYKRLARKYDQVSLQVASRTQDLKLVDRALVPENPSEPKRRIIVLVAAVLSAGFFLLLASFLEFLEMQDAGAFSDRPDTGQRSGSARTDARQSEEERVRGEDSSEPTEA